MVAGGYIAIVLLIGGAGLLMLASDVAPISEPTSLDGDGVVCANGVYANPEGLAKGAGVDLNRYALARMVNSEFSRYHLARVAAAWACKNEARARGVSIAALLTRQRIIVGYDDAGKAIREDGPGDGFFHTQRGSYASTAQDSTPDAIAIADGVISGSIEDPTDGARQFDSPGAFGIQAGTDAGDVDDVAARRIAAGNELVTLPGVPESYARFWRPA